MVNGYQLRINDGKTPVIKNVILTVGLTVH